MTEKRLTINDITSDQLDTLYDRIAELEKDLGDAHEEANDLALHNDKTCEAVKERDAYRAAWHSARSRARGRVQAQAALDRVRQLAAAWADPKNRDSVGMRHAVAATALTVTINGPKEN
ncbi:hypothetical protein [Streptomyces niveus]|uniref:hypothetical protein n=1 Tax=Streptomyces niveus TaxID=193462 RepID=UPI00084CA889|nr:hypothetical protein [Streptomyces niveus]